MKMAIWQKGEEKKIKEMRSENVKRRMYQKSAENFLATAYSMQEKGEKKHGTLSKTTKRNEKEEYKKIVCL